MENEAPSRAFRYLSEEECPNCGLLPGEEGHGVQMASAMTPHGRQVYLLCRGCAGAAARGEKLNENRIREILSRRGKSVPLPESIRG
jgi:hypothetical protein